MYITSCVAQLTKESYTQAVYCYRTREKTHKMSFNFLILKPVK